MGTLKECEWCGKEFDAYRDNARYCCIEHRRLAYRKRYKNKKYTVEDTEPKKKYPVKNNKLVNVAIEARKAGMTYGQYVGMLYLQKGANQ